MSNGLRNLVRGAMITLIAVESFVIPIALLGLFPTDDTSYPGTVEIYWLPAAGLGVLLMGIAGLAMWRWKIKL